MNVLAVVAHADDEVLGCGATLARHAIAGDVVTTLTVVKPSMLLWAESEWLKAADALGVVPETLDGYGDQALELVRVAEIADKIAGVGAQTQPDVVYTHSLTDLNRDHQVVAEACLVAFRPAGHRAPDLLACETVSSSEWSPVAFAPNFWVELEPGPRERALVAMRCYRSQGRIPPHPRNTEGLIARWRWRGRQAGVDWAEAFRIIRMTA